MYTSSILIAGLSASLASAHCLISAATGDLGGNATGLGVVSVKEQSSVTQFSQKTGFGRTQAGEVDPEKMLASMQEIAGSTLPQVASSGGVVTMTVRQINGDGAGPMTCSVSTDASGQEFTAMTVTTQVPGNKGQSQANDKDFPLVAEMPAGATCTGTVAGESNVCIVKCQNPTGPFGGVVPIQMEGGASSGNTIAATANPSSASNGNRKSSRDFHVVATRHSAKSSNKAKARAWMKARNHAAAEVAARGDAMSKEIEQPAGRDLLSVIRGFLLTPRASTRPQEIEDALVKRTKFLTHKTLSNRAAADGETPAGNSTATPAATGNNVQTFTGALGGIAAPAVLFTEGSDRAFAVDGDTFVGRGAALQRSCSIQHNKCSNAANSGDLAADQSECETQQSDCDAAAASAASAVQA